MVEQHPTDSLREAALDLGGTITGVDSSVDFLLQVLKLHSLILIRSTWLRFGLRLTATFDGGNCFETSRLNRITEWQGKEQSKSYVAVYIDFQSDPCSSDRSNEEISVNPDARLLCYYQEKGYRALNWSLAQHDFSQAKG